MQESYKIITTKKQPIKADEKRYEKEIKNCSKLFFLFFKNLIMTDEKKIRKLTS